MSKSLPVQSLDYQEIRKNLIDFLKSSQQFKDYNYEASGISILLDSLAYNTHMIGFYVKMMMNESFVDSALKRESLLAKAKQVGYLPRNKRSARAEVRVGIELNLADDPKGRVLYMEPYSRFTSLNTSNDRRSFYLMDSSPVYDRIVETDSEGNQVVRYASNPLTIYEGIHRKHRFITDSENVNQRFVLPDQDIDIDTIRVKVYRYDSPENYEVFKLSNSVSDIDPEANIFYLSTNETGAYEVFFGKNVFGRHPEDGDIVHVDYLSSKGEEGNGAKVFRYDGLDVAGVTARSVVRVQTLQTASGGMEPPTIEELRFNIPNHFKRQNRAITVSDFKSLILDEFRNVQSINVWSGSTAEERRYGKVFLSIKPRIADKLSDLAKKKIETLIREKGFIGCEAIFVDPQYIDIDIDVYAKANLDITDATAGELEQQIIRQLNDYNNAEMGIFDKRYSNVLVLNQVLQAIPELTSIYSKLKASKAMTFIKDDETTFNLSMNVASVPNTLTSNEFSYAGIRLIIRDDEEGSLYFHRATGSRYSTDPIGTIDYSNSKLEFKIPKLAFFDEVKDQTLGHLRFTLVPDVPELTPKFNDIIRLNQMKARVINDN